MPDTIRERDVAEAINAKTDDLIALIKTHAIDMGAEGQRCAAIAVDRYEEAAMWAVKALFS